MNNKPQVAELRKEIDKPGVGSPMQLRKLAHSLLNDLEAAEARIAELETVAKARLEGIDVTHRSRVKWCERAEKAEAELAAIRGASVPVAYVCTSFLDAKEDSTISKMLPIGTPLFTHPAPPVVVLPDSWSDGRVIVMRKDSVISALNTAGITVKSANGEEL